MIFYLILNYSATTHTWPQFIQSPLYPGRFLEVKKYLFPTARRH